MTDMIKRTLRIVLGDRPVAYHPYLARVMGSVSGGVWLSQILYWDSVKRGIVESEGKEYDGWFFKTDSEIIGETCLSQREARAVKSHAEGIGLVDRELHGMPAKTYYWVNFEWLEELIEITTPVCTMASSKFVQSHAQTSPQSTPEITNKSTPEIMIGASKPAAPTPDKKSIPNLTFQNAQALASVGGMDFNANEGRLLKAAKGLSKANPPPTPELIREKFGGPECWYYKSSGDWRAAKGDPPKPHIVSELWGAWNNGKVLSFNKKSKGGTVKFYDNEVAQYAHGSQAHREWLLKNPDMQSFCNCLEEVEVTA